MACPVNRRSIVDSAGLCGALADLAFRWLVGPGVLAFPVAGVGVHPLLIEDATVVVEEDLGGVMAVEVVVHPDVVHLAVGVAEEMTNIFTVVNADLDHLEVAVVELGFTAGKQCGGGDQQ